MWRVLARAAVTATVTVGLMTAVRTTGARPSDATMPDGCGPTAGAQATPGGPTFLTCAVSFGDGSVTGSVGSGVTVTEERRGADVTARVWDNHVDVVLPAGYTDAQRYPVLYLLHGAGDTYSAWESHTDLDALLSADPSAYPFVIVMPDGGANAEAGWYSDWLDGEWQYETYDTELLPDFVAKDFSTIPGDTGIAGLSMGGFGALSYAARHRGAYRIAASFSGAVDTLYGAPVSGVAFTELHSSYGTPTSAVWGDQTTDRQVWAAHDPATLAAQLAGTTILLASGTGTPGGAQGDALDPQGNFDPGGYAVENAIFQMNLSLVRALTLARVPATTHFYAGGYHGWPYWQADLHWALPYIRDALGGPERRAP